ncbi:MAG: hypothetical protein RIQ90_1206 [Bacteroidota bacterium]
MKLVLSFIVGFLGCLSIHSQRILLVNGHLHPIVGNEISFSLIEIEDGEIIGIKNALSENYDPTLWDTVIDASGQHIYPGLVAPNSTLGLTEIDAVRASIDFREVGEFNPHVRSQIAFNAESKVLQTVKTNGVLLVQATPREGIISGTSSVMKSGGWNWEDATLQKDDGIHVHWPAPLNGGGWWLDPAERKNQDHYLADVQKLRDFFQLAKGYSENKKRVFDQRLEAMLDCFSGNKRVYFHANDIQQISDVIAFSEAFGLPFPVIVGGEEAYLLGKRLADSKIPVMLNRLHRLPEREEDPTDLPYRLPSLLKEQGVLFCLQNTGDMEAMNARNIPFLAGTAMAYGLTELEALKSITLWPCQIMGIDHRFGSIEVGKSATLIVSKGSILDMKTHQITTIILDGKVESTLNFQEENYLKYQKKYLQKNK